MSQLINQFKQSTDQGQIDNPTGAAQVLSCIVGSGQATALVAGQAVKLSDTATGIPEIVSIAANTDQIFGFVVLTAKDATYAAGSVVEIAISGTIMHMTAGAAIARGAKLETVYTTKKVITNAGTNTICGWAFDKAAADGDLIRVWIEAVALNSAQTIADIAGLQTALDIGVKTVNVTATLAEINAGKTLIAGVTGKAIKVISYTARVSGTFGANTSVDIQSSNVTPVKVGVLANAALTNGSVLTSAPSANTTLGAGFSVPLGTNDGLVVANVGVAATTATSIIFTINYSIA